MYPWIVSLQGFTSPRQSVKIKTVSPQGCRSPLVKPPIQNYFATTIHFSHFQPPPFCRLILRPAHNGISAGKLALPHSQPS
jgi:hypothetical protein